jgi:hypothetical protein
VFKDINAMIVARSFNQREVVIVCDATLYGKRKDKLGTLVFKDILESVKYFNGPAVKLAINTCTIF